MNRQVPSRERIPPSRRIYLQTLKNRKPDYASLPSEVLLKIFALLEPIELLTAACVCRRWFELSKDNIIWRSVYGRFVNKPVEQPLEPPSGYWKDQCIKCGVERRNKRLLHMLKKPDCYTKLPRSVTECMKKADIRWRLTFLDRDDYEHSFTNNDTFTFQMSATVRWYGLGFPPLHKVKKLRVYSLNPVFYVKEGKAFNKSPCQKSLLVETDIRMSDLKSATPLAEDGSVKCYVIAESILLAVWKDGGELAFVSACLHFNHLIERCILGSSMKPYNLPERKAYFDDIDPNFGLHDYSCVIVLRNQRRELFNAGFSNLFAKQASADGIRLVAVSPSERVYHQIVAKELTCPWKTELFKGIVPRLCIMDVTVADEKGKPIWCVSSPVKVKVDGEARADFEMDGEDQSIHYKSTTGEVYIKMNTDDGRGLNAVTCVYVQLATSVVNSWFGTKY